MVDPKRKEATSQVEYEKVVLPEIRQKQRTTKGIWCIHIIRLLAKRSMVACRYTQKWMRTSTDSDEF